MVHVQHNTPLSMTLHRYLVYSRHQFTWGFPSLDYHDKVYFWSADGATRYSEVQPSAELRTLIEAVAPWYVVLDKLAEEYPEWQTHFDKAARVVQAG